MEPFAAKKCFTDSGQVMAEFALSLPLFLLLIFGVFYAGQVMLVRSSVQSALDDAGRWATLNITNAGDTDHSASVRSAIIEALKARGVPNADNAVIAFEDENKQDTAGLPGEYVKMTVSVDMDIGIFSRMLELFAKPKGGGTAGGVGKPGPGPASDPPGGVDKTVTILTISSENVVKNEYS